jgi:hypothetical protein
MVTLLRGFQFYSVIFMLRLENYSPKITEKLEVLLENTFLLKSPSKQGVKFKIN